MKPEGAITRLQSNCFSVLTRRLGEILIGCPPEIIKWYLARGRPIPSFLVLPRQFLIENAPNIEPEFPVYGNYFLQKRKATIIGTREQLRRVRTILRESFMGPRGLQEGKGEREFLRAKTEDGKPIELNDLVDLLPFDKERRCVEIEGVTIRVVRPGSFEIEEDGVVVGEVDATDFSLPRLAPGFFGDKPLDPPTLGVSFLGTGSGFDPLGRTTSFVVWIDGRGILVDPVMDPWVELNRLGIDNVDVPFVFLTHCHADHDAGMIMAVTHQRRIRLITSHVVFESFARKAKALTGCDIREYVDFLPADPGDTLSLENASLRVSSALHSIPTVRFEVVYEDSNLKRAITIAYSADTCMDRGRIRMMHSQRLIDTRRLEELLSFGMDADLFIHEAGRDQSHTSLEELRRFPKRVRQRLILVHTGAPLADLEGFRLAREGETVELIPSCQRIDDRVRLLASNSIFEGLKMDSLNRTAKRSVLIPFKIGQNIVRQGEPGEHFYLIVLGKVKVLVGDSVRAVLGRGDCFGEISILSGEPRTATVQAVSHGSVMALDKQAFLEIIREEPQVLERLQHVLEMRPLLSQLTFLRDLSADQLAGLCVRFIRCRSSRGDRVVEQKKCGNAFFVLLSGEATVRVRDERGQERVVTKLGPGDVFGEIALLKNVPRTATVEITSDRAELLRMDERDFRTLIRLVPSLSFYLNQLSTDRLRKLRRIERAGSRP